MSKFVINPTITFAKLGTLYRKPPS